MISFLLFCLIASLIITCIHVLFWDGMLLGNIRANMDEYLPYFWRKPVYDCIICMASFWGITIYSLAWAFGYRTEYQLELFLPFLLTVCGINTLISGIMYWASERHTLELDYQRVVDELQALKTETGAPK